jgi:hypothetical protein
MMGWVLRGGSWRILMLLFSWEYLGDYEFDEDMVTMFR